MMDWIESYQTSIFLLLSKDFVLQGDDGLLSVPSNSVLLMTFPPKPVRASISVAGSDIPPRTTTLLGGCTTRTFTYSQIVDYESTNVDLDYARASVSPTDRHPLTGI